MENIINEIIKAKEKDLIKSIDVKDDKLIVVRKVFNEDGEEINPKILTVNLNELKNLIDITIAKLKSFYLVYNLINKYTEIDITDESKNVINLLKKIK
jgi:hypothetical protein